MNLSRKKIINTCFLIFIICFAPSLFAQINPPKISIIIDDLGYDESAGLRVANLPGPVVCSVLPDVDFSKELAVKCHENNKEIILHTPMEALTPHRLGPGGLYMNMDKDEFLTTLNADIKDIPFISGLNNHEGSRLTSAPMQMDWLMQDVKPQGLFFIDSVTSSHTMAEKMAKHDGVPTIHRDVFLDDIPTQAAVREQFDLLLDEADEKGQAVAIGHPYPATIAVLEQELPRLAQEGYELVPISQLILKISNPPKNWQLPFLKQIWQQVTASNVGFDPLALMQLQLTTIVTTMPVVNKDKRMAIVTSPKKSSAVAKTINNEPAEMLTASNLLRNSFCEKYPDLCYLLPVSKS